MASISLWNKKYKIIIGVGVVIVVFSVYYFNYRMEKAIQSEENENGIVYSTKCSAEEKISNIFNISTRLYCLKLCYGRQNTLHQVSGGLDLFCVSATLLYYRSEYLNKVPPSVKCMDRMKNYSGAEMTNMFTGSPEIVTIKLLSDNDAIKQIALRPRGSCYLDCPKIIFNIDGNPYGSGPLKFNRAIDKIDSVTFAVFDVPPTCMVIDETNRNMFWSDAKLGTIETFDPIKRERSLLVSGLIAPGSIGVHAKSNRLFWCNYESEGSIERVDLDGRNRVNISKGKYRLSYPCELAVDREKKMLYWVSNDVVHSSDFDGNDHVVGMSVSNHHSVIADCISLSAVKEHVHLWSKTIGNGSEIVSTSTNFLSIVTHVEEADAQALSQLSASVREPDKKKDVCSFACRRHLEGFHCVCLRGDGGGGGGGGTRGLEFFDRLMKDMLSSIGYAATDLKNFLKIDFNLTALNTSFYFSLKVQKVFYYDAARKEIRFINMSGNKRAPTTIMKNVYLPADGLAYDWITNNIYFVDLAERNIKAFGLNHFKPRIVIKSANHTSIVALAVQPHIGLMFFVRQNLTSKIIYKSVLNGRHVSAIAAMGEWSADSIMIDYKASVICWLDMSRNAVEKIDFAGNRLAAHKPPSKLYSLIAKLNNNYVLSDGWSDDDTLVVLQFKSDEKAERNDGVPFGYHVHGREGKMVGSGENKWPSFISRLVLTYIDVGIVLAMAATIILTSWVRDIDVVPVENHMIFTLSRILYFGVTL